MKTFKNTLTITLFLLGFVSWSQTKFNGKILDAESELPIQAVEILNSDYQLLAQTNEDGDFSLELTEDYPLELYFIAQGYLEYNIVLEEPTLSSEPTIFVLEKDANSLDELVINVGNRSRNRTVLNSSVPVTVLTEDEIANSGYTSTAEVIQMVVPSFRHDRVVRGDGTESIRPSSMRGMGTDQILVLINGKRRHISAFLIGDNTGVDLNAIPVSAIKTIEVLKDGASALYGSDAIAGVINIILHDGLEGMADIKAGITSRGDGEYGKFGIRKGFELGDNSVLNISMQAAANAKTVRAGNDMRQQYFGTIRDEQGEIIYYNPEGDLKNEEYFNNPRITMIEGDPDKTSVSTFLNFENKIDENTSIYAFGGYNYTNTLNGSNRFRRSLDDGNVRAIFPDGFLARGRFITHDLSLTAGYQSKSKALGNYDLSASVGNSSVDIGLEDSVNPSLGENSPTDFHLGKQNYLQANLNLDFSKPLDEEENHVLSYGAEVRYEKYQLKEGEEASYINGGVPILDGPNAGQRAPVGSQGYVGYRPENRVNKDRNISAVYVDYSADFWNKLNLGVAGRYEYYSDFGSTINGKVSARYEFLPGLAVRSAFNTGFRAPSMQQSYFSQTQTNFRYDPIVDEIVSRENSTLSLDSDAAKALGATALSPEKSYNISAGLTYQPIRNLFFTLDYYMINVDDRIVRTSFFTVDNPLIKDLFDQYGIEGVQSARYFANAISTRTQGFDLVAQYNLHTANAGDFTFLLSYNYNLHEITGFNNPENLANLNETIFNEERQASASRQQSNLNFMISHKYNKWQSTVRMFHAGKLANSYPVKEEVIGLNTMPALTVFDAEVAYSITPEFKVALGGTNLLNQMPPYAHESINFDGNFKYYNGNGSQLGTAGSAYYLKMTYNF